MRRSQRWLVLSFIALVLIVNFIYIAIPICLKNRAGCIGYPSATPAPAMSPGLYRVLWPALEKVIAPNVSQYEPSILMVDLLLMVVCITLTIPALYLWLKQWVDPDRAVFGVAIFGVLYLSAFHWFFRGSGIPIELVCVVWSLALIKRSWLWLAPLVIIAALNRETSLVIPFAYGAYHWRDKWRGAVALFMIWAVVTGGLHIALGAAEHVQGGFIGTLEYNVGTLSSGLVSNLIFIPLVVMVAMAYRKAPPVLKRLTWVAVVYLLAVIFGGAWEESGRLVLPLVPLVLPLVIRSSTSETSLSSSTFPL